MGSEGLFEKWPTMAWWSKVCWKEKSKGRTHDLSPSPTYVYSFGHLSLCWWERWKGALAQCWDPPYVLAWCMKVPSISLLSGPEGQFRIQQIEPLWCSPGPPMMQHVVICGDYFVLTVALLDLSSFSPTRDSFLLKRQKDLWLTLPVHKGKRQGLNLHFPLASICLMSTLITINNKCHQENGANQWEREKEIERGRMAVGGEWEI